MINIKNILLSCVSCLVLSGCYTQLAMFYPEPEIEEDVVQKAVSHEWGMSELKKVSMSLEDVFINIVTEENA